MATLAAYRQALARALDDLEVYTITNSTATVTTVAALVNLTSAASDRRYDGRWLYVSAGFAAGEGNAVKGGGYDPSTGALTVATIWNTAPHAADTLELTGLFPAKPGVLGADTDYRTLVNRALGLLLVPDRLDITTVANQREYGLSTYARWLDRRDRVVGLLDPPRATGAPRMPSWRDWDIRFDGPTPALAFTSRAYPTNGHTLQLVVMRPGDTLINGSESATGLQIDADTAVPQVEDVVTVGLMLAYEVLMNRSPGKPNGIWESKHAAQREAVQRLTALDRTREIQAAPAAVGAA